jgi:hypothetical protein
LRRRNFFSLFLSSSIIDDVGDNFAILYCPQGETILGVKFTPIRRVVAVAYDAYIWVIGHDKWLCLWKACFVSMLLK